MKTKIQIKSSTYAGGIQLVCNLVLVYLVYFVLRLTFIVTNWTAVGTHLTIGKMLDMLRGGLVFDTSAILYTNALYILLMLLPLHWKERPGFHKFLKGLFVVVNGLCIIINLADVVYFQYTGRRTTSTVFQEFQNENNLTQIFMGELVHHWVVTLIGLALIATLWWFHCSRKGKPVVKPLWRYYLCQSVALALAIPLCVCGMRGGATTAVRPITISNANQYVDNPMEAAAVLNTPFALIRTIDKPNFVDPGFMDEAEMDALYQPVHQPINNVQGHMGRNVVVLIVESFGREYIGALNKDLENGTYKGYTPFVDSLIAHSTTYQYSYCNGRKSIDGMPSILSSIPMFVEPFFLTPASMNNVTSLAGLLKEKGYYSAFFHGAENGSMGFQAFARSVGFDDYFGRTEFNEDKRFRGDEDYDGTWAIWDEPFMQFYALKMNEFKQPFVSSIFTASSHDPYVIPESYKAVYPEEGGNVIHKCIRYTDHALKRFFETAQKQPWYKNTLFVLTSDHTNLSDHPEFQTSLGGFCSPIVFFDPSGEMPRGMQEAIAQQIDIMPTVLGYLGYDKPYVAFGCDLLHTPADETWAVNYLNGIYQYVEGEWLLQFDGEKTTGLYRYRTDSLLEHNLAGQEAVQSQLEERVKAIIQSYMQRMIHNKLVVGQ